MANDLLDTLTGTLRGETLVDPQQQSQDFLGPNMGAMSGLMGFRQDQAEAAANPMEIKTHTKDGKTAVTIETDMETALQWKQQQSYLTQALMAMTSEVNRLKAQEDRARQNPLLHVLSTVAGNLAAGDPRLPPVVSALGRANLQLNPQPEALAARRMGLEEQIGRTAAVGGELALRGEQAVLARQREQREIQREERIERTGAIRQLNEQAMRGELSDPKLVTKIISDLPGMTPEKAQAQAAELVAASQERQKAIAAKEAATDERQRRALEATEKTWDKRLAMMAAGFELRERMAAVKEQAKAEGDAKKQTQKELEVPKTIPEKLAHLKSAESTLDQIEAGLQKYSKYQGIVAGRLREPIAAYFKSDVAKFFNKIKLQVSQAIQSTGAGARGFGPWERGYFTSMTEAKTHSPEENLGIIQSWRDYLRAQRESYIAAYKGLRKQDTVPVLGKDKDLINEYGATEESTGDPVEDILRKYAKPK